MRTPRYLIYSLCLCLFATEGWAQPKKATPREEAAQKYQEGETQYKLQKYEEALTSFQESYALSKEPSILFNIAQCYRLLGRLEEARKTYLSFLRDVPGSPLAENANARIAEVEAEISRLASKGSIQISSKQDPAEVFLNGEAKGQSPITLPDLEPGDYRITLKKKGFSNSEITASVKPSEISELKDVRLAPLAELNAKKLTYNRKIGFALAGGGVALGTAGTIFAKIQVCKALEDSECIIIKPQTGNEISELDRVVTIVTMGTGISLLATGAVFYILNTTRTKTKQEKKPSISITPTQGGFSTTVQFPIFRLNQS